MCFTRTRSPVRARAEASLETAKKIFDFKIIFSSIFHSLQSPLFTLRGAMVARLTPDQKVACSYHVGDPLSGLLRQSLQSISSRLVRRRYRSRSVVVITSALHADGPRFEPDGTIDYSVS